jgi:hypothetical protein
VQIAVGSILSSAEFVASIRAFVGAEIVVVVKLVSPSMIAFYSTIAAAAVAAAEA